MRWPALHRLMEAGRLPVLHRLVEDGLSGAFEPDAHPAAVWATMATGAHPLQHGILTPEEVRPDGGGVQPFGAASWGAPPLWDVLARAGVPTLAVAAPGTTPATDWPGAVVDDRYALPPPPGAPDWPLPPRCVQPPRGRDALRALRLHPAELHPGDCAGLHPAALAEAVTIQAAALHLMEAERWQAAVVFHPLAARDGSDGALQFLDAALGHLLGAAGPGALALVASPAGVLVACGPGIPPDTLRHGLGPADVAATALARFGLSTPSGQSLAPHGPLRALPPPAAPPPLPPFPPAPPDAEAAMAAVRFTHAKARAAALSADGDHAGAAGTLDPWLAQYPHDPALLLLLGQSRFFAGRWRNCLPLGRALHEAAPDQPWGAMLEGAALCLSGDTAAGAPLLRAAAARAVQDPAALSRLGAVALHLRDAAAAAAHYSAAVALAPGDPAAHAGLALAHLLAGRWREGEAGLRRSLSYRFHAPALHHQLALLLASQGRWPEAQDATATALSQNPALPGAQELAGQIRDRAGSVGPG